MNIYDISERTGFSTATVSRVINGSSNVSEKTRQKVLAVIEEYGYTPNVFARGLGLNTMKTIGVMCTDSSDRYMAQAVYYLEVFLRRSNYDMILCCTGYEHSVKEKQMKLLLSKRVDAVVLVGSSFAEQDDKLNTYIINAAKTVPVMMINGVVNAPNIYCTLSDDYTAIYETAKELLSSGRKKPLYITSTHSYSARKKLKGFYDAAADCGLKITEKNILEILSHTAERKLFSPLSVKTALEEHFSKSGKFDCIIASEDVLAVGALKYIKSAGFSILDDIALIGYNNSDLCECTDPEMTSIDNKLETVCEKCVSSLMELFSGEAKAVPKQTVFSCELIRRETT